MNDSERLENLVQKLRTELGGIDQQMYDRMSALIGEQRSGGGCDAMGRLKVAVFDTRSYEKKQFIDAALQKGDGLNFTFLQARFNRETVSMARGYRAICLFVQDELDAEAAAEIARYGVKLVALRSAGYNNVDLRACEEHGISVVRVPAYSPYAVAEHSVALMLALNRKLHMALERVRQLNFTIEGLVGFDMHAKTVGVLGTGKIGLCAIDILRGFGCRVLAFDKFKNPALSERPGVEYVELNRIFRESDIISLHVPLLPETRHIVNRETISLMKDGVMLINTSRGALVDTRALIDGLKSGKIGSAGLDVYEEEEGVFSEDHSTYGKIIPDDTLARLCTFNNVLITAHQAYLTNEALRNIADATVENILEFRTGKSGKQLTNAVAAD